MDKSNRALYGLSLGHLMLDMYAAILIPLYPVIAQKLNINIAAISLIIAIGHSVSSILQPVFGYISDKLNKRLFMFWGLIFVSLFIPLGYMTKSAVALACFLVLGMMGNAFYHPQVTSMIQEFYQNNQKYCAAIGLFLGLGTIGYSFGPYISAYFLQKFGDSNYFYIGVFGVLFAFFMLFFVPKIRQVKENNQSNFFESIKDILSDRVCVFLVIITVIKAALVMSFGTYIPFLLKKFDFPLTNIGLILTLFYIMGGISMIISAKIEKSLKLKGIIVLSYLPLLPLTLLSIYFLRINTLLSSICFIIIGFFVLLAAGVVLSHAQNIMSKHTGTIAGIIQGFTLAVGSLLLIPLGLIGQKFSVEAVLIVVTSTAFIASIYTYKTKLI